MIAYDPILQSLKLHPGYRVEVLRLDAIHPHISGNKWFKLKYNLEKALAEKKTTVVTFGGAFSNHLAATAAACKLAGIRSAGIVRGEKAEVLNPTLAEAEQNDMQLHFVSREQYAEKNSETFRQYLDTHFSNYHLIPEGGNNSEGMLGCKEILHPAWDHDLVFCACGTATTFSGLVLAAKPTQRVIGISVLKGTNTLPQEVMQLLAPVKPGIHIAGNEVLEDLSTQQHGISNAYAFSGYAKYDAALVEFKNAFEDLHPIPLDHVYTVKLFYAVNDLLKQQKIRKGARVLIVHSGGLQGNRGFEERYHLTLTR